MNVLVAVASKHGGTAGIAEAVAEELRRHGLEATIRDVSDQAPGDGAEGADGVDAFDAVVLGSAVYVGHWTKDAVRFVEEHLEALRTRPLWLFSSGPLGDPPATAEEPADAVALADRLGARGHELFLGRLERAELGVVERAAVRMVHAPYGDFREWDRVRAWAERIAQTLTRSAAV
jgi:menaquinone-dependent protoporphyrinogen oxidase